MALRNNRRAVAPNAPAIAPRAGCDVQKILNSEYSECSMKIDLYVHAAFRSIVSGGVVDAALERFAACCKNVYEGCRQALDRHVTTLRNAHAPVSDISMVHWEQMTQSAHGDTHLRGELTPFGTNMAELFGLLVSHYEESPAVVTSDSIDRLMAVMKWMFAKGIKAPDLLCSPFVNQEKYYKSTSPIFGVWERLIIYNTYTRVSENGRKAEPAEGELLDDLPHDEVWEHLANEGRYDTE